MPYQTVKNLSPLDAGYLAGLIDGEGSIITLSRRNLNKHRALVVTVSNTELSILKHVQEITGVGKITNKRISKAHHTPSFTYQAANRHAIHDFLWSEATGLPVDCFAEKNVEVKAEEVFRHINRAYPTVSSPYFSAHAAV